MDAPHPSRQIKARSFPEIQPSFNGKTRHRTVARCRAFVLPAHFTNLLDAQRLKPGNGDGRAENGLVRLRTVQRTPERDHIVFQDSSSSRRRPSLLLAINGSEYTGLHMLTTRLHCTKSCTKPKLQMQADIAPRTMDLPTFYQLRNLPPPTPRWCSPRPRCS